MWRGALIGLLAIYALSQFFELQHVIKRDQQIQARPLSARLPTVDKSLPIVADSPVQQLLRLELAEGLLTEQQFALAQQIYAQALEIISAQMKVGAIVSESQALKFLSAVGVYIEKNYRYETTVPLGQGFIQGVLDCDMRVLLYLSLAQDLGYQNFYFVLAPAHALIGWQGNSNHAPLLWETTRAAGHVTDLSHKSLYQPVTQKIYGDYQLASASSALVRSQIIAATAWVFAKQKNTESTNKALQLFQRSLDIYPSANHAAAQVMFGSDNLVADMPRSIAYAEYAKTYPQAIGARLYYLSLYLAEPKAPNEKEVTALLIEAEYLLQQGVVHPVLVAIFDRYGNVWQKLDSRYLQALANKLAPVLYPSNNFGGERNRVAEARAFIYAAAIAAFIVAFLGALYRLLLTFISRYKFRSPYISS